MRTNGSKRKNDKNLLELDFGNALKEGDLAELVGCPADALAHRHLDLRVLVAQLLKLARGNAKQDGGLKCFDGNRLQAVLARNDRALALNTHKGNFSEMFRLPLHS